MKTCTKCHIEKPLDHFPPHKRTKDKRGSICKACRAEYARAYRASPEGKAKTAEQSRRYNQSEKGRSYARSDSRLAYEAAWRQSREGKKVTAASAKRFRESHKGDPFYQSRFRAGNAVRHAVAAGKIPKVHTLECVDCPAPAQHYHHHLGYSRKHWLDVVPLCIECHERRHHS